MKQYVINEVFYSLQGEGLRAGTANVFVRFAGCNLTCKVASHGFDCDTNFTGGYKLTGSDLVERCTALIPHEEQGKAVVLTGGEPMLQVDQALIMLFHAAGWYIAIETNGSLPVPLDVDWITVSPKVAEHAIQQLTANEVKYVLHSYQALPKPVIKASAYLVSPAWGPEGLDQKTLCWCIEQVKQHPRWRLSVQQHKVWGVQ